AIATPATLTLPNEKLDVQISTSNSDISIGNAHGTADLHSGLPVHGIDADPQFSVGSFAVSGEGFTFDNLGNLGTVAPGAAFTGITANVGTGLGSHTATLVFHPT